MTGPEEQQVLNIYVHKLDDHLESFVTSIRTCETVQIHAQVSGHFTRILPGEKASEKEQNNSDSIPSVDIVLAGDNGIESLGSISDEVLNSKPILIVYRNDLTHPVVTLPDDDIPIDVSATLRLGTTLLGEQLMEFSLLCACESGITDALADFSIRCKCKPVFLEYDLPFGFSYRIFQPVLTELWKIIREGVAQPGDAAKLVQAAFGNKVNLVKWFLENRTKQSVDCDARFLEQFGNSGRFTAECDFLQGDSSGKILKAVSNTFEPLPVDSDNPSIPGKILIAGTPSLVELWSAVLSALAPGSEFTKLSFWHPEDMTEDEMNLMVQRAPFDLVLDCSSGPVDVAQDIAKHLSGVVGEQGQLWVNTLMLPAGITIQKVPLEISAVGFGGIPPLWEEALMEFSTPFNSGSEPLRMAAATAKALGMNCIQVADEPGGVVARILAVLVNAVLYTVREGLVSTGFEADYATQFLFQMQNTPLKIADLAGLDTLSGVLEGLAAFYGTTRYHVCPEITFRIESNRLGHITGDGFYI